LAVVAAAVETQQVMLLAAAALVVLLLVQVSLAKQLTQLKLALVVQAQQQIHEMEKTVQQVVF